MAVRDIKTTIMLDGEKAFKAELRAISKEMRVTNSELKVLKTGFDNADDQMANLTRQSQLAKEKLEQQKIVVAALEREVRDAAKVHGDASNEVRDLTLKLNSARVAMNGMVKESQQVDREIEELGREKAFEAELRAISKEMRVTDSELKALKTGFDNADDQMANLTRQSQLAKEKLEQQKIVVAALEREVRDAARVHGDASDEVRNLTLKLNSARVAMNGMVKESQQIDREIEELGRDSQKAGRQIKNGIGDAAEETSRDLRGMMDSFSGKLGDMRNMLGIDLAMDLGSGVVDLVQGVNSFAESSRDFNRQMSFLENNARQAGLDLDFVKDKFIDVASVTGETDGAVEGLSNLLQTGFDETEMEKAIRGLIGAAMSAPDTWKFEELASSLRETLATGQATGQYAEVLEQMSIDLDEFNAAMEASTTLEGDQQIVLGTLTGKLTDAGNAYQDMNQDLIDAEESSKALEIAANGLGRTLDTWLTPGRNKLAEWLTTLNELLTGEKTVGEVAGEFILSEKERAQSFDAGPVAELLQDEEVNNARKKAWADVKKMLASDFGIGEKTRTEFTAKAIESGWMTAVDAASDAEDHIKAVTEAMTKYTPDLEGAGSDTGAALGASIATGLAGEKDLVVAEISATVDQINEELSRVNPINLSVNTALGGGGASTGGEINVSLAMDGRTVGKVVAPYVMQAAGRTTAAMTTVQKK